MSLWTNACLERWVRLNFLNLKKLVLSVRLGSIHGWFKTKIRKRDSSSVRKLSRCCWWKWFDWGCVSRRRELGHWNHRVSRKHFSIKLRYWFLLYLRQIDERVWVNWVSLRRRYFKRSNLVFLFWILSAWESFVSNYLRSAKPLICKFSVNIINLLSINWAKSWNYIN